MRVVDPAKIERFLSLLPNHNKENVMNMLGTSLNTWTKLKRREVVRSALIEQAVGRMDI